MPAPEISSVNYNSAGLVLHAFFTPPLDTVGLASGNFSIRINGGSPITLTDWSIAATPLEMTCTTTQIYAGDVVTWSYDGLNAAVKAGSDLLLAFTDEPITNNSAVVNPNAPRVRLKYEAKDISVGGNNSFDVECFVFNATHENVAVATILADTTNFPVSKTLTISGTNFIYTRTTVQAKDIGDGLNIPFTWDGNVGYVIQGNGPGPDGPWQTDDQVKTFEIGMQSVNVKQSKSTTAVYTVAGTVSTNTFLHTINNTGESIEGVDIDVPTFAWSLTRYYADADVDDSYIEDVYEVASNPVNDDTFFGFAAGTTKFLGMQGTQRGKGGNWELNYRFASSPNETGIAVGAITGIAKKGWEYLWVRYNSTTSASTPAMFIQAPLFVCIEKVYNESDFDLLGLDE